MKPTLKARDWHTWVSLILSLPLLIVGLTAIFLAHGKTLGLGSVAVAADWLPGYGAGKPRPPEARAFAQDAAGRIWLASKAGLFFAPAAGDALQRVAALPAGEIRQLLATPAGLYAAGKNGLWRIEADKPDQPPSAERLADGELFAVAQDAAGQLLVAHKDKGWLVSAEGGRRWRAASELNERLGALTPAEANGPLTLGRLMFDLHTGRAFFGKTGEWIWIDLLGAALTLLGLTGVYLWWRSQRRQLAVAAAAALGSPR